MRVFVALVLAAMLSGCGFWSRQFVANTTGYDKVCVEGVSYLQFPSGSTLQVDIDGKPVACK